MAYYPQKTMDKPYKPSQKKTGLMKFHTNPEGITFKGSDGERYPKTVQYFKPERGLHPTQKPVALIEYLINTYTNSGEIVLDNCMGSGSAGVAAKNLNRRFIGIEIDETYFNIAKNRIEQS